MPIRAIDHIDLAVADVERSLEFYPRVLGPLGVEELCRYPSYRGSEEIVYLRVGDSGQAIGCGRPTPATTAITRSGSSTSRCPSTRATRWTRSTGAASRRARGSTSRPRRTAT